MIRNDGKYKIYIIKHLYKDKAENEWAFSGDCEQWIPKNITRTEHNKWIYGRGIFRPLTANGLCWQKTGVHGSFVKRNAIEILDKISEWNPEHRFKVCRLLINQVTEDIVEKKYATDP